MRTLIKGGYTVNEGIKTKQNIVIEDDTIADISTEEFRDTDFDRIVDATDCCVLPGIIDTHVHFREPGLTHKADMETESRAAAYGGVTTVFEMPNTKPQTTDAEALAEKYHIAQEKMHVNYSFFPGATNDNIEFLRSLDAHDIPGIKLFMGSSTGNMLVDKGQALDSIFQLAHDRQLPLMAHCEDTKTINDNMARIKEEQHTDDPDVTLHPQIRSRKACIKSSTLALQLAQKHNTRLHIAHISTEEEVRLLQEQNNTLVTGEATVAHLTFCDDDYRTLGALIKCNPAIKSADDRTALRKAIAQESPVCTIGTDHAPHAIEEKMGGAAKAMSGMPSVQYALPCMMELVSQGVLSIEQLVRLMAHNPATLFSVNKRGFLRKGYKADIAIVRHSDTPWTITKDDIQSKCNWSPMEGMQLHWRVMQTFVSGQLVYDNGDFHNDVRGQRLTFRD